MKNKKQFILGKEYKSYGKYIGIVRNVMHGKYDYKEHRFSVLRGINLTAHINAVKIDDKETINEILKNNA
jgi:hypothetical protein